MGYILKNKYINLYLVMTQFLPTNLLALFAPRSPISYKAPPDELLVNRKRIQIHGIAQYVGLFEVNYFIFFIFYLNKINI